MHNANAQVWPTRFIGPPCPKCGTASFGRIRWHYEVLVGYDEAGQPYDAVMYTCAECVTVRQLVPLSALR